MTGRDDRGPARRPARRGRADAPIVRRGTVRLQHDVARRVRLGHPWIYREALDPKRPLGEPGSAVELVDWDGEPVGYGVYDGESAISIRMMTRDGRRVDDALIVDRVRSAIAMRKRFFDFSRDEAIRLINAESDGLPAIAVERYGDFLVAQIYAGAMVGFLPALYDALERELAPKAIYEQRRFRSLAGDAPRAAAATLVRGVAAPPEVEVREGDLRFAVDVSAPLSTGLFPDLRDGRRAVARWSRGRRVLNLFSYTGAISVYAVHGGATEVAAVDVAPKAHARARRNLALSGLDAEKPEYIVGDAFKVLAKFAERGRSFDLVVLDPPAFASAPKGGGKPWSSNQDYGELVEAALRVLQPGGVLAAASSTHKMSSGDFDHALAEGAARLGTELRIVERLGLPPDFPVAPGFPEGNYLKFAVAVRD